MKRHYIKTDYRIFNFLTTHQYLKAEKEMPRKDKIKIIQTAIDGKKHLQIIYLKANDTKSERTIKPLEVGWQTYRGKKYQGMRAFCFKVGEERMFRIDRILKLDLV